MHIVIFAIGSQGDVQPYVALGQGLRAAGHSVRVLSTDDFGPLITVAGLEFCPMGESTQARLQIPEWQAMVERGNILEILPRMGEELKRGARQLLAGVSDGCRDADLMITGMGGLGGGFSVAEKLNLPVIQAYLSPLTPTAAFPGVIVPVSTLGSVLNRLSHHLVRQGSGSLSVSGIRRSARGWECRVHRSGDPSNPSIGGALQSCMPIALMSFPVLPSGPTLSMSQASGSWMPPTGHPLPIWHASWRQVRHPCISALAA